MGIHGLVGRAIYRENTEPMGCIFMYWGCGTKVRAAWKFRKDRQWKVEGDFSKKAVC